MHLPRYILRVATLALAACSSGPPPDPVDVEAARACQAFRLLIDHAQRPGGAPGEDRTAVLDAAVRIMKRPGEAVGDPQAKWYGLGVNLLKVDADLARARAGTGTTATLKETAKKVTTACGALSNQAKIAGGFVQ